MSISCCDVLRTDIGRPVPIKPPKMYVGTEFPTNAPNGAVFLDTSTNRCFYKSINLTEWAPISNVHASESRQTEYKNITNCRNCGAPVKGHKCEYCETRY